MHRKPGIIPEWLKSRRILFHICFSIRVLLQELKFQTGFLLVSSFEQTLEAKMHLIQIAIQFK